MYIEKTENSYRVYLTKEETALLDKEDKKLLKPCKIPKPIKLNSLQELKESIEKQYDKNNIAIL